MNSIIIFTLAFIAFGLGCLNIPYALKGSNVNFLAMVVSFGSALIQVLLGLMIM